MLHLFDIFTWCRTPRISVHSQTNYCPSVLWRCWLRHLTDKNRPRYDCVWWDIKPYSTTTHLFFTRVLLYTYQTAATQCDSSCFWCCAVASGSSDKRIYLGEIEWFSGSSSSSQCLLIDSLPRHLHISISDDDDDDEYSEPQTQNCDWKHATWN